MHRAIGCVGLVTIFGVAWLLSENRRKMNFRLILSGLFLQFLIAAVLLRSAPGRQFFDAAKDFVNRLIGFSDLGAKFVFGAAAFKGPDTPFAVTVLPALIFVAAATAVLFHLGVMQWIVKGMARVMVWVMDTSGTESLAAAAEVFVGMTESPLLIRPYIDSMTRSELLAMMTAGLGTVAGSVLAAYASLGIDAGHLLTASLMAAPASLVIAKILVPETEKSPTKGVVRIDVPKIDANVFDAACRGAADGLKLALNVLAMLIAFIALVGCVNWMLGLLKPNLSMESILGWCCQPLAWLMGVEWKDANAVGMLLGKKVVLNEMIAYTDLRELRATLSPRSVTIATYALCGFANFGSVAIQIGGVGGLVPGRRREIAELGLRAMIGGVLTTLLTATIAGLLIND